MDVPQKIKNTTTIWFGNSTSGIYPKEIKLLSETLLHPHVIIAKTWKQSNCPLMDEWIKKMVHTHQKHSHTLTHTYTQTLRLQ